MAKPQAIGQHGYRDAADGEAADLCVVNTCTVMTESDAKSRQVIRQLTKLEIELRDRYFGMLRGRRLRVLVESPIPDRPGFMHGAACRYAPVILPGDMSLRRQFVEVIAGDVVEGRIVAEPTPV